MCKNRLEWSLDALVEKMTESSAIPLLRDRSTLECFAFKSDSSASRPYQHSRQFVSIRGSNNLRNLRTKFGCGYTALSYSLLQAGIESGCK